MSASSSAPASDGGEEQWDCAGVPELGSGPWESQAAFLPDPDGTAGEEEATWKALVDLAYLASAAVQRFGQGNGQVCALCAVAPSGYESWLRGGVPAQLRGHPSDVVAAGETLPLDERGFADLPLHDSDADRFLAIAAPTADGGDRRQRRLSGPRSPRLPNAAVHAHPNPAGASAVSC